MRPLMNPQSPMAAYTLHRVGAVLAKSERQCHEANQDLGRFGDHRRDLPNACSRAPPSVGVKENPHKAGP